MELDARVEKLEAESVGLKDAKQGRQEPFSGSQSNQKPNQENDSENYPQQMCLPWQAWHGDGMLVPLEEAEGRADLRYHLSAGGADADAGRADWKTGDLADS